MREDSKALLTSTLYKQYPSSLGHMSVWPNQAMQPTTLWRGVSTLTLVSMLGMKPCAPAGVVADLVSR